jgi:hypothetical protein
LHESARIPVLPVRLAGRGGRLPLPCAQNNQIQYTNPECGGQISVVGQFEKTVHQGLKPATFLRVLRHD